MSEASILHKKAMEMVDKAHSASQRGTATDSQNLMYRAFQAEKEAASLVKSESQPTHSVLHRSAAALAVECGELSEAEKLIKIGLDGNPPDEIAEELRDLMLKIKQDN